VSNCIQALLFLNRQQQCWAPNLVTPTGEAGRVVAGYLRYGWLKNASQEVFILGIVKPLRLCCEDGPLCTVGPGEKHLHVSGTGLAEIGQCPTTLPRSLHASNRGSRLILLGSFVFFP
jgi:hypothetical protein